MPLNAQSNVQLHQSINVSGHVLLSPEKLEEERALLDKLQRIPGI
jgi:hypothetical protein